MCPEKSVDARASSDVPEKAAHSCVNRIDSLLAFSAAEDIYKYHIYKWNPGGALWYANHFAVLNFVSMIQPEGWERQITV